MAIAAELYCEMAVANAMEAAKDLPDTIREYDREAVRPIPELLARATFELYRLR